MIEPDIGFAVDVGIAGDTPGISDKEADSKLGDGPQIILYDASMVSHKGLRDLVVNTAEKKTTPSTYQRLVGGGQHAGQLTLRPNEFPPPRFTIPQRAFI